jgi:pimeloyl-ACP methyl ester carboxylesterase
MEERSMRSVLVALALAGVVASCSSAGDTTAAPSPTTSSTAAPPAAAGGIDAMFDVGGHKLHLACQGTGSPTLVYLHGLGGDSSDAPATYAPLAKRVRVCVYDRVNAGRSDSDAGRHTGADSVRDLHALLDSADVAGPYLLVGFSFGGLLATMYAGTYPEQVMGILMLDSSLPTDDEVDQLVPEADRPQVVAEVEGNQERVEVYKTLDQAKALVAKVPDVPVTYMAAEPVDLPATWPVKKMRAFILAKQTEFVGRFPKGRLVRVKSSHDIDLELPDRVLQEAERILSSA